MLDRLLLMAVSHVDAMRGHFNNRPYHGLIFGRFNKTSSQVGKVLYAMAVHAVQTRALHMGGVVKVQVIAAVNSRLQRSLSAWPRPGPGSFWSASRL